MFNSREIATGIWLVIVFVYLLSKQDVRKSMVSLLEVCCKPKIVVPIGIMACYTVVMVRVLSMIGLWTTDLLKDTVFWFILAGLPLMNYVSEREVSIFWDIVRNNVKSVVFIEFLVGTYTFPLAWELLLMPFATVIAMIDVLVKSDNKYAPIAKLTFTLQGVIGFVVITFAVFRAFNDYMQFLSFDTLRSFLLSPLLSVLHFPFIYALVLYANYERLFIMVNAKSNDDKRLKRYRMFAIIAYCRWYVGKLWQFKGKVVLDLRDARSRDDVDMVLERLREKGVYCSCTHEEQDEAAIPKKSCDGWSKPSDLDLRRGRGHRAGS